jgi:hypothetical protein
MSGNCAVAWKDSSTNTAEGSRVRALLRPKMVALTHLYFTSIRVLRLGMV